MKTTGIPRILTSIVLASTAVGCAATPARLDPATVSGVRSTLVVSYIPENEVRAEPGNYLVIGRPLVATVQQVAWALHHEALEHRLGPLQEATRDVDFREEYWKALEHSVDAVDWLRVERLERNDHAPRRRVLSPDVARHSLLTAETHIYLSEEDDVLLVDTELSFYAQSQPDSPVAQARISYRSEEIGTERDEAAVAQWAAGGASRYRTALEAGILANTGLAETALRMMSGDVPVGKTTHLRYRISSKRGAYVYTDGSIVDEGEERVSLRTAAGDFLSLPRDAVQEVKPDKGEQP
jgi:hypothetical protein